MKVESERPSKGEAGGWLHKANGETPRYVPPPKPEREVTINAPALWQTWWHDTTELRISALSNQLGVTVESLEKLGCCWASPYSAYGFPMSDGRGVIVGIRLRTPAGDQFAVKGSHAGIFTPDLEDFIDLSTLYVCEGASDCAALLSMGLPAIGRHACRGQEDMICQAVKRLGARRVVICADSDSPGVAGAESLQKKLPLPSILFIPQTKDMREFLNAGGTAQLIRSMCKDLVVHRPSQTA